jgi:fructoselysine-6-P-deglycase FrlB-like protein
MTIAQYLRVICAPLMVCSLADHMIIDDVRSVFLLLTVLKTLSLHIAIAHGMSIERTRNAGIKCVVR